MPFKKVTMSIIFTGSFLVLLFTTNPSEASKESRWTKLKNRFSFKSPKKSVPLPQKESRKDAAKRATANKLKSAPTNVDETVASFKKGAPSDSAIHTVKGGKFNIENNKLIHTSDDGTRTHFNERGDDYKTERTVGGKKITQELVGDHIHTHTLHEDGSATANIHDQNGKLIDSVHHPANSIKSSDTPAVPAVGTKKESAMDYMRRVNTK